VLRLLLDQHAGGELYDRLVSIEAFDIERVRDVEGLGPRADDPDIWRYAVENSRVVLTNDGDFTDGTADPNDGTHPGVIRYIGSEWGRIVEALTRIEQQTTTEQMAEYGIVFRVPSGWLD
jgi:predicted nuclease of predicted toxin-antitoxin system